MKENRELIYALCIAVGGYMEVVKDGIVKLFRYDELSKQFKRIK